MPVLGRPSPSDAPTTATDAGRKKRSRSGTAAYNGRPLTSRSPATAVTEALSWTALRGCSPQATTRARRSEVRVPWVDPSIGCPAPARWPITDAQSDYRTDDQSGTLLRAKPGGTAAVAPRALPAGPAAHSPVPTGDCRLSRGLRGAGCFGQWGRGVLAGLPRRSPPPAGPCRSAWVSAAHGCAAGHPCPAVPGDRAPWSRAEFGDGSPTPRQAGASPSWAARAARTAACFSGGAYFFDTALAILRASIASSRNIPLIGLVNPVK